VTAVDWMPWVSLGVSLGTPVAVFVGRNWLKARIEKGVQHHFDRQIEGVRAELRQNEERLKSDLRDRESEISALRNTVLDGSASRQSMLDKRRFEAAERIWTAANDHAELKSLAASMAILNYDAVAKRISHEPKLQQVIDALGAGLPTDPNQKIKNVARDEQPFVSEPVWAYFSAYTIILLASCLRYRLLKVGLEEPGQYMSKIAIQKILTAALPDQTEWIDQQGPEKYYYLLDELERNLLSEIQKMLGGKDTDQASLNRAKSIMSAIATADAESARREAVEANEIDNGITGI
jgi:hypothetical protein